MKKAYRLLFIFSLIFSYSSFAQQHGYVITQKNDTIRCEVKKTLLGASRYKVNNDFKKIKVDDIKEYQFTKDSTIYRAVALKPGSTPVYLQVIEDGKICLYEQYIYSYYNNTSTSTTNWYVSKGADQPIYLKTSSLNLFGENHETRKNELADLFADEPTVAAEYKADDSFSFKKIRKYIQEYNHAAANKIK